MGGIELLAEQSLEQPREHPHVQEEAAPAGDPLPVACNPAAGHDAVQMRVMGVERDFQMTIAEPEQVRVLTETDEQTGTHTAFIIESLNGHGPHMTIA